MFAQHFLSVCICLFTLKIFYQLRPRYNLQLPRVDSLTTYAYSFRICPLEFLLELFSGLNDHGIYTIDEINELSRSVKPQFSAN